MVRILLLFFFYAAQLLSQDFSATAGVDSARYLIGDFINYRVRLKFPEKYKYSIWEVNKSLGGLELVSVTPPKEKSEAGKKTVEITYVVAGYDSGTKVISGGEALFINPASGDTQRVAVDSVSLYVSIVEVDTAAEIKDINDPRKIPLSAAEILMWAGILLALIIAGYFIYKYFSKKEKKEVVSAEPELPPDVLVIQKLDELEEKRLWQNGLIKEYHTEITGIVRWYFEQKLKIPALEMTTGEICDALLKGLNMPETAKVAEEFLNNADLVKFAKFVPLAGINEEMMRQARRIVALCAGGVQPAGEVKNNA